MRQGVGSLEQGLARRLLLVPEVGLDEDGLPKIGDDNGIARGLYRSLSKNGRRILLSAYEDRIAEKDFRFIDLLRDASPDKESIRKFEERYTESLKEARIRLDRIAEKVRGAIEQGTVDGVLLEVERTDLSAELEAAAATDSLNFRPLFERLGEIEIQLEDRRESRLRELQSTWTKIKNTLERLLKEDELDIVQAFIKQAFDQQDTRVVEESLARLREFSNGDSDWRSEWFEPPTERDVFQEFHESCASIENGLSSLGDICELADSIEQGAMWGPLRFDTLSIVGRDEAVAIVRVWQQLISQETERLDQPVREILRYIGFQSGFDVRIKRRQHDLLHCDVELAAREASSATDLARPIPQLGSQAHGRYTVICLWERRGIDSVVTFLRDPKLDAKLVILLFMGRLTSGRRREFAMRSRERGLEIVILDEILLVFLAQFEAVRLPTFLRCSLPYTTINPYTPFQAGSVPPEIFYGRQKMVDLIQQANEGSCIVFGGRQLGKSALLNQVQREFHRPSAEQFAWVEDIKTVGDPLTGESPDVIWIKLRDAFKKNGLLREHVRANEPRNIINHIQTAMDASPQRRVIVLFDEADHFLDADAERGFTVVEGLRGLIQKTELRLKVVFAGLHDVQRFKNISNQPLAHFGRNLLVGPLEASAARRLVVEPMTTLGYRFANENAVLKVLSYTNYHPGLIQYYCRELLHRLDTQVRSSGPPYEVGSDDVESVYRLRRTREIIRERLDWTLALDVRYQCVAWAMIYEQKEAPESYARLFSVTELLELAQQYWSEGFEGFDTERLAGLLGEMVGLGILVRNLEGQYLLRSPNLVRLMGTEEDIESRLLELSEIPKPAESKPESQHYLLQDDPTSPLYSPLTLVQEGLLQSTQRSGVSLVFGSEALGLDVLSQALTRVGGEVSKPIPSDQSIQADQMVSWLERYAARRERTEQLLTYGWLNGSGEQMARCVTKVLQMCKGFNQRRRRALRVVFVLNPQAAWSWMGLAEDERVKLENRAEPICLRRWDEVGIQQRMNRVEKLDLPEVCGDVLEATGGWTVLLDELLRRCGADRDPRGYGEALIADTSDRDSVVSQTLLREAGLTSQDDWPYRVLQTLAEYGGILDEDIESLADVIDPSRTHHDCSAAVLYLERLGCIERHRDRYQAEPVLCRVVGTR